GAARGAVAGSSVKKDPQKPRYSTAVPGAIIRKLAAGSSRGKPPNTASCTGKVPSRAAAVAARDTAAGFHSLKARPFPGLPKNTRARGWYKSTIPRVAVTERAKPKSPPAKGLNRH